MKNKGKDSQRGNNNNQAISRRDFVTKTAVAGVGLPECAD